MAEHEMILFKHTEQRLICLVGTIQRTDFTASWEDNCLRDLINNEAKCSRVSLEKLSSNPTRFGNVDEYKQQFQVNLILSSEVRSPNYYICQKLTTESFLYERIRRRILFRVS